MGLSPFGGGRGQSRVFGQAILEWLSFWAKNGTVPGRPVNGYTQLKCRLDFRRANGETWCIDLQPPPRVIEVVGGVEQERYATAEEIASDPDDLDFFELRPLLIVKRLDGRQEADAVRKKLADDLGIAWPGFPGSRLDLIRILAGGDAAVKSLTYFGSDRLT